MSKAQVTRHPSGSGRPLPAARLVGEPWRASPPNKDAARAAGPGPRGRNLEEQLAALRREHAALQQALYGAAQLQRKLCAPRELRCGPFEIASEIFAVRHLSGDFYTVFESRGGTVLAVGDIAGKGLNAGLWFAHLLGLIRIFASSIADLPEAVSAINAELCRAAAEPPLAAVFLGRLDPRRGELVYCNAGQPPALLLRRNAATESLQVGGPMLGAVPRGAFACGRVAFEPGDTLIAYSDGVVECRNAGEEEFGRPRLLAAARGAAASSAGTLLFSVLGAVQDFANGHARDDDLTLMVVRRRDAG